MGPCPSAGWPKSRENARHRARPWPQTEAYHEEQVRYHDPEVSDDEHEDLELGEAGGQIRGNYRLQRAGESPEVGKFHGQIPLRPPAGDSSNDQRHVAK